MASYNAIALPNVFGLILMVSLTWFACSSWRVAQPAWRDELIQMMEHDQLARQRLIEKGYDDIDSLDVAWVDSIDVANTKRLQQFIEEKGWPRKTQVGTKGVKAAFLIVQHADHVFQKEMLPLVQTAYEQGELSGQELALLTDRELVREGKPQRYGTQAIVSNGAVEFSPIEAERAVDERRAALGLMPLAQYKKRLERMYRIKTSNTDER